MISRKALQARIDQLEAHLTMLAHDAPYKSWGCSDGNCIIQKPSGMHTNGGCQHLKGHQVSTREYETSRTLQWIRIQAKEVLKCTGCHGIGRTWVGGRKSGAGGQASGTCQTCKGSGKYTIIEEVKCAECKGIGKAWVSGSGIKGPTTCQSCEGTGKHTT